MVHGRSAFIGLVSGLTATVLGYGISLGVRAKTGQDFPQLGLLPIAIGCLGSNVMGAWAYSLLPGRVPAPRTTFAFLVAVVAFLYTMAVGAHPPAEGFLEAATPIHLMAAVTAIFLIPGLSNRSPKTRTISPPSSPRTPRS